MVVKLLREPRDDEHMRRAVTIAEAQRIVKEGIRVIVVFGVLMTLSLALVQYSRFESARNACEQTNQRHDDTMRTLTELTQNRGPTGGTDFATARQIEASRVLIEALAPRTPHCAHIALKRVFMP